MEVWKLVVLGILVLLFLRIPIMMALNPLIPDIKTWREALFAGHFGPIGVGALFVAILARAVRSSRCFHGCYLPVFLCFSTPCGTRMASQFLRAWISRTQCTKHSMARDSG